MSQKYILYARKSTDVEDKQVLSIEAQVTELRKFAADNDLQIVDTIIEKRTAKMPGRPKFGNMLGRIEAGEASGILAWHPDRLARNSIDGGQIVYLLDQTRLTSLKFPTFWFENTSQGKFMLSIAFGQSKYYVDNLSENTKRGLRQKLRRGEYPSRAPLGYINDLRNKNIVVDKRIAPIIVEAFELYAQNQSRYEDVADFLASHGLVTRGKGTKYKKDRIRRILSNPFYYGHFLYKGEVYEGTHKPIISKKLFDKVQTVLAERGRPRKANHSELKIYCGLLRCYSCGLMITAEKRIKHQKNGNRHEYVYYHCTKKRKDMKCLEAAVREKALDESLTDLLQEYALPDNWRTDLLARLEQDERNERSSTHTFVASAQTRIASLQSKLQRLLDSYLDQDIDRDTYLDKKAELMSEKKSLEEQSSKLTLGATAWVEPMRQWLDKANSICNLSLESDKNEKKVLAKEIFGSNLFLQNKKACSARPKSLSSPLKNQWTALRAARQSPLTRRKSCNLAGMEGFEPPNAGTRTRCLTTWRHPNDAYHCTIEKISWQAFTYKL